MLADLLVCTAWLCVIALPGTLLVALVERDAGWPSAAAVGAVAGLSAGILGGYYCLLAGLPFAVFLALEYAALGACLLVLRGRVTARHAPQSAAPRDASRWLLPLVLLLVFASRAVPLFFGELPPGVDPAFHALIAKKIVLAGAIPQDWTPFEPLKLNYPVGSHLLVAAISRLAGVPVHVAFKALFPALACLTTLSIHAVALRILASRHAALLAAIAYAFLAGWGSLDVYRWGGLPSMLGLLLLLGMVDAIHGRNARRAVPLFAALFAALLATHHHGALTAGILFGSHAAFTALVIRGTGRIPRLVAMGFAAAAILAAAPLAAYVRGAGEIGRTSVFAFHEPLVTLWSGASHLGLPFVVLGAAGIAWLFVAPRNEGTLFLVFWVTLLVSLFAFLEYAYRFGVLALEGQFFTALTPTRFLGCLAYPLSIAAGFALARLVELADTPSRRQALRLAILGASLAWAAFTLRAQCAREPVEIGAYDWIASHSDEGALVLSPDPWAAYLAWREVVFTPLPASEARNDARVETKRRLRDVSALVRFHATSGRSVYLVAPIGLPPQDGLKEAWRGQISAVHELR